MDTDADCHIAFRHQGSSLCEIICLWMLGIIRGEVAVGGSGHDNSKASVFKQLFKSHCNTEVDILSMTPEVEILPGSLPPCAGCSLRKL